MESPKWLELEMCVHRSNDESVRQCFDWSKWYQYRLVWGKIERYFLSRMALCSCPPLENYVKVFWPGLLHQHRQVGSQHKCPVRKIYFMQKKNNKQFCQSNQHTSSPMTAINLPRVRAIVCVCVCYIIVVLIQTNKVK